MKALKNNASGVDPEKLKAMLNLAQDQQTKLEKTLSSETKVSVCVCLCLLQGCRAGFFM